MQGKNCVYEYAESLMDFNPIKYELQNILSGKGGHSLGPIIQAITHYLRTSQKAGPMAETKHQNKGKETEKLLIFAQNNNLWYDNIDEKRYVSEGAEQKVYIKNEEHVLKLNDAIYYASWEDYFHNLLLHNYFFPDTAYHFLGFYLKEDILYAVVKQAYIRACLNFCFHVEKFRFWVFTRIFLRQ